MKTEKWHTKIIKQGQCVFSMEKPEDKTILWQVTDQCNQNCKYCYKTFSLDKGVINKYDNDIVSITQINNLINDIKYLGFSKAYILGGEVMLFDGLAEILNKLYQNSIKSYFVTNLSFLPKRIEHVYRENKITSFSFSLDSINEEVNDYLRGNTSIIIENAKLLIRLKKQLSLTTELGVGVVVSKINLYQLKDIINWAINIGLDCISLNLVYLPESHQFYNDLYIRKGSAEYKIYLETLEYLKMKVKGTKIRIPGKESSAIVNYSGEGSVVSNCFCEREIRYLYVDSIGNVNNCPCKTNGNVFGNVKKDQLRNILSNELISGDIICSDFSFHCLGVWGSAYPKI